MWPHLIMLSDPLLPHLQITQTFSLHQVSSNYYVPSAMPNAFNPLNNPKMRRLRPKWKTWPDCGYMLAKTKRNPSSSPDTKIQVFMNVEGWTKETILLLLLLLILLIIRDRNWPGSTICGDLRYIWGLPMALGHPLYLDLPRRWPEGELRVCQPGKIKGHQQEALLSLTLSSSGRPDSQD